VAEKVSEGCSKHTITTANNVVAIPARDIREALNLEKKPVARNVFEGSQEGFPEDFICTTRRPHPQILVILRSFLRGGPKICLEQSCSRPVPHGFEHQKEVGGKGTATR